MTLDIAIHKNILLKILKDIYSDATIGTSLGFKGGTAALLFYGLNRFSIDLDFDLLDASQEDYVFKKVQDILSEYGVLKECFKKRFNLFYLLAYADKARGAHNVKVEINRRNFGSKYEPLSYLGISMNVMVQPDITANKLCALYERAGKTTRDIFDVYFFLHNNWPVNKKIVEERAKMPYKEFLKKCLEILENTSDRNTLAGMGELLDEKQKFWVKSKLKNETIFLLRLALENEK